MLVECTFNQVFDDKQMVQYVNNEPSVMHCHHYATLFTKLAMDMKDLNGPALLAESMEEAIYLVLKKYFIVHKILDFKTKLDVAEQFCGLFGLGKLKLNVSRNGGSAVMTHSHVDEGWKKKWSRTKEVVNFMGQGYISASFEILNDMPLGSYKVTETKSIVKGSPVSEFKIDLINK
jgi:hypothetical protein